MASEAKHTPGICEICGEPMPEGERMFKFHGYSGPCPKPPLPRPKLTAMIEYLHDTRDGKFWLDIRVDRQPYHSIPFDTEGERQRAHDDLLTMMRSVGAKDMPNAAQ